MSSPARDHANDLVERLMAVPYRRNGNDWAGCDCWGLVELWYRERLGVGLADRRAHNSSPEGLMAGHALREDWIEVERIAVRDDDVVTLRAAHGGRIIQHGHCGIYWRSSLLHTDENHGPVCQPITARLVASRITGIYRHKALT